MLPQQLATLQSPQSSLISSHFSVTACGSNLSTYIFQKDPAAAGRVCACVWNFWTEVEPLLLLVFSFLISAGGPWALGWHGPTKTHPSCCANVQYLQLLNRDGMWPTQEPPCRFSRRITSEFELSTWTGEGGFSFFFLHSWRNLRLRWTSCQTQFSAYIVGFFLAYCFFLIFQGGDEGVFLSLHTYPRQTLPSGVTEVLLHDRCIPHQNSIRQVWASVCVCVSVCVCLLWVLCVCVFVSVLMCVSFCLFDLVCLLACLVVRFCFLFICRFVIVCLSLFVFFCMFLLCVCVCASVVAH